MKYFNRPWQVLVLALIIIAQVTLSPAPHTFAVTPITFDWQPDGLVNAVALTDDTMYIGGQFNYVGPDTGNFAALNTNDGSLTARFPNVVGTVDAMASDGSGGWYLGGQFSAVGGTTRSNLAHLRGDGSLDANWNPGATLGPGGTIDAIAVVGSNVYVGGDFIKISGESRSSLAALDATTGALHSAWNPNPSSIWRVSIATLVPNGNTLYVGGKFDMIGGKERTNLAALNLSTGQATDWNPNLSNTNGGVIVNTIAFLGTTAYVGGDFYDVGGQQRWNLAAFDTTKNTSNLLSWNAGFVGGDVRSIVVANNNVYIGGGLYLVNGQNRNGIAALDPVTAAVSAWNPGMDDGGVNVLSTDGLTLYAGGGFKQAGGTARGGLAAFDLATNTLKGAFSGSNGQVMAMAVGNGTLYIGGTFTSVGGSARTNLAAFDRATGALKAWSPTTRGSSYNTVYALAIDGSTVYIGGDFFSINDQGHFYVGAVDAVTGAVSDWSPRISVSGYGVVYSILPVGTQVIVGGRFDRVNSTSAFVNNNGLVALDRTTGEATGWNPSNGDSATEPVTVQSMVLQDNQLYIGGLFARIGDKPRTNAAAINMATGQITDWAPQADKMVLTLLADGATVYAGGLFSQIGGRAQPLVAALDATSGQATEWQPQLGGAISDQAPPQVWSMALDATNLYVAGEFRQLNGVKREWTAAIDRTSSAAAPWNVDVAGRITSMALSGNTLYLAGRMSSNSVTPLTSFEAVSLAAFTGEATHVGVKRATLNGSVHPDGVETNVVFQLTRLQGDYNNPLILSADPATVSSTAPTLVHAEADNLAPAVYYYRIVTSSSAGTKYGAELSFDASYKMNLPFAYR